MIYYDIDGYTYLAQFYIEKDELFKKFIMDYVETAKRIIECEKKYNKMYDSTEVRQFIHITDYIMTAKYMDDYEIVNFLEEKVVCAKAVVLAYEELLLKQKEEKYYNSISSLKVKKALFDDCVAYDEDYYRSLYKMVHNLSDDECNELESHQIWEFRERMFELYNKEAKRR